MSGRGHGREVDVTLVRVMGGVAGMVLLAGTLASAQQSGTVRGVVTTDARAPRPIRVTFDQRVCGQELPDQSILVDAAGRLANVVVTLVGVKAPAPAREARIENDHCAFVPRVQVVAPGASVKTSSRDAVLHTTILQQPDGRQLFNVALPVPGIEIAKPLTGSGVMRVACSTHQWMRGWVVVTDELSAVTGPDGTFTITGVPPGTHELRFWHEALVVAPRSVKIDAGQVVNVQLAARPRQ